MKKLNIIKRDGRLEVFSRNKIYKAIMEAMSKGSGIVDETIAKVVSSEIRDELLNNQVLEVPISNVETMVYLKLIEKGHHFTAKAYEGYRATQEYKRHKNTTDLDILNLIGMKNKDVQEENSNKNPAIISTQRDLIAGEVSKDISRRKKLPAHIVQAHDSCALHFHDLDYFIQRSFNCCLVNLGDMLDNGTAINDRMIESPKSFQVACTVMTQIIARATCC